MNKLNIKAKWHLLLILTVGVIMLLVGVVGSIMLGNNGSSVNDSLNTNDPSTENDNDDKNISDPSPQPPQMGEEKFDGFPVINVANIGGVPLQQNNAFNRTDWRNVSVTITNTTEEFAMDNVTAQLRGRGNSSWNAPKRPFRLRFDHENVAMPGADHVARDWTFITNHADFSLLRNTSAYYLGSLLGGTQTPYSQFAHVYFNGEYQGVYKISVHVPEPVPGATGRAQTVRNPNPELSEYILEHQLLYRLTREAHLQYGRDWITINGRHYRIRYGGTTPAHVEYLREFMQFVDDSIMERAPRLFNVICKDSLIDFFIVRELFRDHDAGRASMFMQIQGTGFDRRVTLGPLWDFDHTAGATTFQLQGHPYYVWLPNGNPYTGRYPSEWFQSLILIPEFREAFAARMKEVNDTYLPQMVDMLWQTFHDYEDEFARNFQRWHVFGTRILGTYREKQAITTHRGQVEWLVNWLTIRADWLSGYYNNYSPYFDVNINRFSDAQVTQGSRILFIDMELSRGTLPSHVSNLSLTGYSIYRIHPNGSQTLVTQGRFPTGEGGHVTLLLQQATARDAGTYRVVANYTLTYGRHTLNLTQPFGDITLGVN